MHWVFQLKFRIFQRIVKGLSVMRLTYHPESPSVTRKVTTFESFQNCFLDLEFPFKGFKALFSLTAKVFRELINPKILDALTDRTKKSFEIYCGPGEIFSRPVSENFTVSQCKDDCFLIVPG